MNLKYQPKVNNQLENFDNLFVGNPKDIEKNLKVLLPQAKALKNKSIYLQILSQIALAQAVQKKFKLAHKTLDKAEKELTPEYTLAEVRITLERGRIFHQSYHFKTALAFFKRSYKLSKKYQFDNHTINAAHMVPIVINKVNEKIKWNKIAINIAKKSRDKKAKEWLVILYQNLGQNYIEAKQYKKALALFKQSQKLAEKSGLTVIALGAKLALAKSLRLLNLIDKALNIQLLLLQEFNSLFKKRILPIETLRLFRGQVFEELVEIYLAKVRQFSGAAYQDLSKDAWFVKLEPKRIERMNRLQKSKIKRVRN